VCRERVFGNIFDQFSKNFRRVFRIFFGEFFEFFFGEFFEIFSTSFWKYFRRVFGNIFDMLAFFALAALMSGRVWVDGAKLTANDLPEVSDDGGKLWVVLAAGKTFK
jgi:hypothetical protein